MIPAIDFRIENCAQGGIIRVQVRLWGVEAIPFRVVDDIRMIETISLRVVDEFVVAISIAIARSAHAVGVGGSQYHGETDQDLHFE